MKKQNIILVALITTMIILLSGCDKTDENQKPFIGKWKLISVSDEIKITRRKPLPFEPPAYDYTDNNVNYEFKRNGILIITSDIDELAGLQPGRHSYKIEDDIWPTITIDAYSCDYGISKESLSISHGSGDDPWQCKLIRIE